MGKTKLIYPSWRVRYYYDKAYGKAFIINNDVGIDKRTVKPNGDGIYSPELGNIVETDKDLRQYSCACGKLNSRLDEGDVCEDCGTVCKETFGADLTKYGWIDLGEHYVIEPSAYEAIKGVIGGKNLEKMIKFQTAIDIEGQQIDIQKVDPKAINFQNIGLDNFRKYFTEIMNYYIMTKPLKAEKAKYLLSMKNRIFSNKIPVFSSLLRPAYASSKKRMFSYDKINSQLTSILSNGKLLKNGTSKRLKNGGDKLLMWSIQDALQTYYHMTITSKISGKSRTIRNTILSTRTSFSSRAVITSLTDPKYMGMDHIVVNYKQFIELFTLQILNCMMRGIGNVAFRNMTTFELLAYLKKAKFADEIDEAIYDICIFLIKNHKQGLWVIINRNPTMDLGSQQTMKIVHVIHDINSTVMQIPLTSLSSQIADFDGDVENLYAPMELQIIDAYIRGFSPRYLLLDRTGDDLINGQFLPIKDNYTVANTFLTPLREPRKVKRNG